MPTVICRGEDVGNQLKLPYAEDIGKDSLKRIIANTVWERIEERTFSKRIKLISSIRAIPLRNVKNPIFWKYQRQNAQISAIFDLLISHDARIAPSSKIETVSKSVHFLVNIL